MARNASKRHKVIRNPDLVREGQQFVPVFGNATDRSLVDQIIRLEGLLETVDNEVLRSGKNLTKKMNDILFMEKGLIKSLISRNNDF